MKKRLLFSFTGIIAVTCFTACNSEEKEMPNILFIMADDHSANSWGIYGGILEDYAVNENIKWLAQEGVVLNNAFCTNAICMPSRASIMSGKYSHLNGVFTLEEAYHPDSMNVAKLFRSAGYQTAIYGKWHLHSEPSGFDDYLVLPGNGLFFDPLFKSKDNWKDGRFGGKVYEGYSTDLIADFSIDWLKKRDTSKPFLLFTHFNATHEPFDYPERYDHLYEGIDLPLPETLFEWGPEKAGRVHDGWPVEIVGDRFDKDVIGFYPHTSSFSLEGLDKKEARMKIYQKLVKDYLRCGAGIDDNIGRLIEFLREEGLLENTIVIYTSDQGYFLGEHGFFDKRFIYEESIKMPFVIYYPRELNGNRRIDDIILNIDFPSLLLDYAGIEIPPDMQGRSFRENLKGNTPDDWRQAFYYRYWLNTPTRPAHIGIRDHRYKLAFFYGQSFYMWFRERMPYEPGWEFYDLKHDPQETRNAYHDPQYKTIIDSLKNEMIKLRIKYDDHEEENPVIRYIMEEYWLSSK